jgi:hypothetical protein
VDHHLFISKGKKKQYRMQDLSLSNQCPIKDIHVNYTHWLLYYYYLFNFLSILHKFLHAIFTIKDFVKVVL